MTIRVKITLWFSALMIVIFAIMFSMIFIINRYVLYSDVKGTLRTVVEENRDEIEYTEDFDSDDVEPGDHYILRSTMILFPRGKGYIPCCWTGTAGPFTGNPQWRFLSQTERGSGRRWQARRNIMCAR